MTKWITVKLPEEFIAVIDELIKRKDKFGLPRFRSRTDVVTEAVKHLAAELLNPEAQAK